MQNRILSLFCAALVLCCAGAANACGNGKLLFEEKFAQRPAYIAEDAAIKYADGALIETRNNVHRGWVNWQPTPYRDYEVCAKVSASADKTPKGLPVAGVVFFVGASDYYVQVQVNNIGGSYQVAQRIGASFQTYIPWITHAAINRGPTAENEVSVSTRGNFALIRINGKDVAELNFPLAGVDGKTWAGIHRQSAEEAETTFRIKDYQIREAVWDKK